MPELLDPRKLRDSKLVDVDLGDGTFVKARRSDLATMIFEGLVTTPLMAAAQRFIENREMSPAERIAELDESGEDTDHQAMLEVLRQHALTVVVQPVLVPVDDGDESHIPVTLLTITQLLAIWNQTAITPKVGAAEAATFRSSQRPAVESFLRPRENVRKAAESMVATSVERRGA